MRALRSLGSHGREQQLALDRVARVELLMRTTLMILNSCFTICSSGADSTSTTIVMRLNRSSSVGATASEKML